MALKGSVFLLLEFRTLLIILERQESGKRYAIFKRQKSKLAATFIRGIQGTKTNVLSTYYGT